jgi:hypothetical protein
MAEETGGILQVGEVPVVRRRDPLVEIDHTEALRSGRREAYADAVDFAQGLLAQRGAYDDTRPLQQMLEYLADRIRQT